MAANRFATALHRNSHKTVVVLVYAVLEWVLILMLLLNSFFSFLIRKFAAYFGLKPPCVWCSMVDSLFEPRENVKPYGNLICEAHATEISNLHYSANHQNLISGPRHICRDCLLSLSLTNEDNSVQDENGEKRGRCSCCNEDLSSIRYLPLKKGFLTFENDLDKKGGRYCWGGDFEEREECGLVLSEAEERFSFESTEGKVRRSFDDASRVQLSQRQNEMAEVMDSPVENYEHLQDFDRIILLEWTDSSTSCSKSSSVSAKENVVVEPEKREEIEFCHRSVRNEREDGDEALTIERLKAELEAERLALSDLYIELDEERNASETAANQTMAMITRLQEEKAALQIEAMQNQRMMEEQAEYDQEALQLLNELVIKREKEKLELETELEMYREKFLDTEGKGKAKLMSRNSCGSCSTGDESLDENDVLGLKNPGEVEESMVGFEDERISILDELRELQAKIFMLADDLDEDLNRKENLEGEDEEISHSTWIGNSFAETYERLEEKDGIEKEIDHVYEMIHMLQALEADREFVKQSVDSMRKGDEGMELLQEILQHRRDLRSIELQVMNSDSTI